ncbi:unnamed protein product [Prunus brigantina]
MSGTPTILPLIADSQKHTVNHVDPATGLMLLSPPPNVLLFIRPLKITNHPLCRPFS